jgi:hypothetical protein
MIQNHYILRTCFIRGSFYGIVSVILYIAEEIQRCYCFGYAICAAYNKMNLYFIENLGVVP